eukprot:9214779-Karenia_brevis.AAC.1
MVQRAQKLSKDGVEVEAPVEAREVVAAASSKSASSRSPSGRVWRPATSSASSDKDVKTAYERNWSRTKKEKWHDDLEEEGGIGDAVSSAASDANEDDKTDAELASRANRMCFK